MRNHKSRHLRVIHSNPEPIAGNAGLCHLEYSAANLVPVSYADFIVRQAVDGKILSELSVLEIIPAEIGFPISIGFNLVDHHGPLLAPMSGQVCLAVTVKVQSPGGNPMGHGTLPDRGSDKPVLPLNFSRKADIDRQ